MLQLRVKGKHKLADRRRLRRRVRGKLETEAAGK